MSWMEEDNLSPRLAIAQICELGIGSQEEVSEIFGITTRSVHLQSFRMQGAHALATQKRGPKGSWKVNPQVKSKILYIALNKEILTYEVIKEILDRWGEHVS